MHALPVRAKSADPIGLGTAHCSFICHCDDGSDYAVKDSNSGPYVKHSEWFCKLLGDSVGIASPECRIVEVNGEEAFGSRWESKHDPENWVLRIQAGLIDIKRVAPTISRIFAFDLFVENIDRHTNNYIVRPQANNNWSFLAFDYSKAWLATGWPLKTPPMNPAAATTKNFKTINKYLGGILDIDEAMYVLDNILSTHSDRIEMILSSQPKSWLEDAKKNSILSFWKNGQMETRVKIIKKGLANGIYI